MRTEVGELIFGRAGGAASSARVEWVDGDVWTGSVAVGRAAISVVQLDVEGFSSSGAAGRWVCFASTERNVAWGGNSVRNASERVSSSVKPEWMRHFIWRSWSMQFHCYRSANYLVQF